MLETLSVPLYTFLGKKRVQRTRRIELSEFAEKCRWIVKILGARILTKNIDVTEGLVNSAACVETGSLPPPNYICIENYCPKFIYLKFDNKNVRRRSAIYKRQVIKNNIKTNTVLLIHA